MTVSQSTGLNRCPRISHWVPRLEYACGRALDMLNLHQPWSQLQEALLYTAENGSQSDLILDASQAAVGPHLGILTEGVTVALHDSWLYACKLPQLAQLIHVEVAYTC
jgi:hypothetical protein